MRICIVCTLERHALAGGINISCNALRMHCATLRAARDGRAAAAMERRCGSHPQVGWRWGSAPKQYSVFGKSLNFECPYLNNLIAKNSKLIGFEHGAAPQGRIR